MKVIKELDHPVMTVREVRLFVRQYVFADGMSSYDVHLADGRTVTRDGEPTDCLTRESFDHMPATADIEALSYIKPSVRQDYPGVFYILTAHYQKGPYSSRKEANADIRAGRW